MREGVDSNTLCCLMIWQEHRHIVVANRVATTSEPARRSATQNMTTLVRTMRTTIVQARSRLLGNEAARETNRVAITVRQQGKRQGQRT